MLRPFACIIWWTISPQQLNSKKEAAFLPDSFCGCNVFSTNPLAASLHMQTAVLVTLLFSMARSSCGFGHMWPHRKQQKADFHSASFSPGSSNASRARTQILRLHATLGHALRLWTWCCWSCRSIIRFPSVEFLLRTLAIPWNCELGRCSGAAGVHPHTLKPRPLSQIIKYLLKQPCTLQ